ncbi:MAG: gatA [Chlamydiales bacterium]|jgi:aspartyl-tRNA(Asn)/glutamyl-tRNA(Gln) amidotransferase subunit A|nr:gatA [Chlamydiales bacterium]
MEFLSALESHRAFISGKLSATEMVQFYLDRIAKYDPKIGAFLSVYTERAIAQAKQLDSKRAAKQPLGKLAGVVIALKDNIHYKGEITTCASQFLTNYRAPFDATVTERLLAEDAIIIGKANLDEFAMGSTTENSALKKTYNPWSLDCVAGGSSGGSAAAVAARMSPISLGSDTGGSIRFPASLCGIVGFKPTYGRVSRYGLVSYGSSLDQIGPFAYTVEDIALTMEVLAGHCEKDSTSIMQPSEEYLKHLNGNIAGMKIGVPWEMLKGLSSEAMNIFKESLKQLEQLGAQIVDVNLSILKYSIAAYYILATAEASTNLARFDGVRYGQRSKNAKTLEEIYDLSRKEGFGDEVKRRIVLGTYVLSAGYQDAYYKKAQKVRTLIIKEFKKTFQECQAIVTPTSPIPAFPAGSVKDPLEMYLLDIFTIPQNLAGLPSINVPAGFTADRKPFGIQFTAPQLQDRLLLQLAHAFESQTNYGKQMPEWVKS